MHFAHPRSINPLPLVGRVRVWVATDSQFNLELKFLTPTPAHPGPPHKGEGEE